MHQYSKPKRDSSARIFPIRKSAAKPAKLRAAGSLADESMQPGTYRIRSVAAEMQTRGGKTEIKLRHVVDEGGVHDGVIFTQWLSFRGDVVLPSTAYYRQCEIALGRPIRAGEDLEPREIFLGKHFLAKVGFRLTDEHGRADEGNAEFKKDDHDFLKVLALLELR